MRLELHPPQRKQQQQPLRLAKLTCFKRQLVNTRVMFLNLLDGIDPFDDGMKTTYIQTLIYLHIVSGIGGYHSGHCTGLMPEESDRQNCILYIF